MDHGYTNDTCPDFLRRAKKLWRFLFREPWPDDLELVAGVHGVTVNSWENHIWGIFMQSENLNKRETVKTLVHEMLHCQIPSLHHEPPFDALVEALLCRALANKRRWK